MRSTIAARHARRRRVIRERRIAELRHPVVRRTASGTRRPGRRSPTRRSGCRGGCRSRRSRSRRPDRPSRGSALSATAPACATRRRRSLAARIGHLARDVAQRRAQRRRAAAAEVGTCGRDILIEVRDRAVLEAQRIVLDVLGRADQSPLLRVPRGEDDRALRAPARLHLFGHRARRLEHAHGAAHVVAGAGPPRVAMPADDHDLVRELAAAHDAEGVVDRLDRASSRCRCARTTRAATGPGPT